jgi:hypothetical protein
MKQAFERSDAPPATPSKPTKTSNINPSTQSNATPTPKRKRIAVTTPKNKAATGEEKLKPSDNEDGEEDKRPKRARGDMHALLR